MENENNSLDNDLFANVCDEVVEQIAAYLPLNDKIKLEGVSKQWQRCMYYQQTIIKINESQYKEKDSLNAVLKPTNCKEISIKEFEYVLKRCKRVRSLKLDCHIDDTILQSIGKHLFGLKLLQINMNGITENGLLEFARNYGHKLEKLDLYESHNHETVFFFEFLKYCPNLVEIHIDHHLEFISEDKSFLPKLHVISADVGVDSIENLRIKSEKYEKTIKKFNVSVGLQFESRAFDYISKCAANVKQLTLKLCFSQNSDDNQMMIDHYIWKLSHTCLQLESLCVFFLVFNAVRLPSNMFYAFEKFSSIKMLEIFIYSEKIIDCKCECFKLCANLKHLRLYYTQISDVFFKDISQHLPNLRSIDLHTEILLTDRALILLSKLQKLKKVFLRQYCDANRLITDIGVCQLITSCTRIEVIYFSALPRITNTTINCLIAIAMQRNRIRINFWCRFSNDSDERQYMLQFDNNRLNNLPKNLEINFEI